MSADEARRAMGQAVQAVEEYASAKGLMYGDIVFRIQDGRVTLVRREEQEKVV